MASKPNPSRLFLIFVTLFCGILHFPVFVKPESDVLVLNFVRMGSLLQLTVSECFILDLLSNRERLLGIVAVGDDYVISLSGVFSSVVEL